MAGNSSLAKAKDARQDEFYTRLTDIEKELRHYRRHFQGKTVLCNCDDPFESNFFKYFALNFNRLGLKKLMATCYSGSPITGTQLSLFGDATDEERRLRAPGRRLPVLRSALRVFRDARRPHQAVEQGRHHGRRQLPDALPRLQPQEERRLTGC